MPRKLRLEFPGAIYHVINRGNYRTWIFATAGAKQAFASALFTACERRAGRKGSSLTLHHEISLGTQVN